MKILFLGETFAFQWIHGLGRCGCTALPVLCCNPC